MRHIKCIILVSFLAAFWIGCGGTTGSGASSPTTPAQIPTAFEGMTGFVQKGPFSQGSTVTIQVLDDSFNPTGTSYTTQTTDDFGSFELKSTIDANYVEVSTNGFYFNEVSGELSEASITLRSLSKLSSTGNTNINILTTLARDRLEYLMENSGKTFEEANTQAKTEILSIFHISSTDIDDFDKMDIRGTSESDAILLAVSVILQGSNTTAELSELMAKIISDVKTDGTLDNQTYVNEIKQNGMDLYLQGIRSNLEARYQELGVEIVIPRFEDFVDSDGDGTINRDDQDTYVWVKVGELPWSSRTGYATAIFDDKLWIMGGYETGSGININKVYKNDVWSSNDGSSWDKRAENASWSPRAYMSAVTTHSPFHTNDVNVIYDSLYIFCGSEYLDGNAESKNGYSINALSSDGSASVWAGPVGGFTVEMYGQKTLFYDNKIWLFGGVKHDGTVYKDVWMYDDTTWTKVGNNSMTFYTSFGTGFDYYFMLLDDKIWAVNARGDAWYTTNGNNWTGVGVMINDNSQTFGTAEAFNGKLWVIGGTTTADKPLWYSENGSNWTQTSQATPWAPRFNHVSVVFNDMLFVMGGTRTGNAQTTSLNDIWVYMNYQNY